MPTAPLSLPDGMRSVMSELQKAVLSSSAPQLSTDPEPLGGTPLPVTSTSASSSPTSGVADGGCAFGEDHGKLVLKGASFNKIVEWVVFERDEKDTQVKFLLTYKQFVTPAELFKVLTQSFLAKSKNTKDVLRPKLATFLREWASRFFSVDFKRGLFKLLLDFVVKELPLEANFFKLLLIKDSAKLRKPTSPAPSPKELVLVTDWLSIAPEVLAEQLTLLGSEMFQAIQPTEFYGNAWQKKDKETTSPNLTRLARFFNTISFWAATEIIRAGQPSLKHQTRVLKYFLLTAEKLLELYNFDSLMAILSALSNSSVSRLRRLWDSLPDKYYEIHQKLEDIMKPTQNFKAYRDLIAVKPKDVPVVPYLAVYLRDVTFVCDGNPDRTEDGLINFEKLQLLGSRIMEVQSSTSTPYVGITPDPSIRALIKSFSHWDEEELYSQSLLCEPLKGTGMPLLTIPEEDDDSDASHSEPSLSSRANPWDPSTWGMLDVVRWIESIGKGEYREMFEQNGINGARLLALDDATLINYGMIRLGHRKRLLKDVQELAQNPKPETELPTDMLSNTAYEPLQPIISEPSPPTFDPVSWTTSFGEKEVTQALQGLNATEILALTHEALIARGLDKLGHRKRVLKSLQSLKEGSGNSDPGYKDVSQWSVSEVGSWLDSVEQGEYKSFFSAHQIDGIRLLVIANEDLIAMGISKLGHRKAIQKAVQQLKEQNEFRKTLSAPSTPNSRFSQPGSRPRRRSNPLPSLPSITKMSSSYGVDLNPVVTSRSCCSDYSDEGVASISSDEETGSGSSFGCGDEIAVQCVFGNTSRVFTLQPTRLSIYKLNKLFTKEYGKRMTFKFLDKDGDLVNLNDNDSLSFAIQSAIPSGQLLLHLFERESSSSGSGSSSRRARSTTAN